MFVSIIILLVLGVSLIIIVLSKNKAPTNGVAPTWNTANNGAGTPTGQTVNNVSLNDAMPTPVTGLKVRPQATLDAQKNAVKQLARLFIERYNSFSNGNEWQNIKDVQELVTDSLWKRISVNIGRSSGTSTLAVTTQVATMELTEWKDDSALVAIFALRDENRNGTTQQIQKNYQVEMMKVGENWLVNKFEVK